MLDSVPIAGGRASTEIGVRGVRRALGSVGAFLAAATALGVSILAGHSVTALVCLLVMGLTAPVSSSVGRRFLVGLVVLAGVAGGLSLTPGFRVTRETAAVLLGTLALLVVAHAWRHGFPSWRVPFARGEAVVAIGALGVLAVICVPVLRVGPELVLVDVAKGYDDVSHYSILTELVGSGALGGADPWIVGYPYGYHMLPGLFLALDNPAPISIVEYFLQGAVLSAACAAALGFLALQMSNTMSPVHLRRGVARTVAYSYAAVAGLGGLFVSYFAMGHVPFLLPVVVVTCASWLAFSSTPGRGGFLLLMGASAALGAYPSIVVGAIPAAGALAWEVVRRSGRRSTGFWASFALLALLGLLAAANGVGRFLSWSFLDAIASGNGDLPVSPLTPILGLALTCVSALMVLRRLPAERAILRSLGPVVAFTLLACVVAFLVWASGNSLDDSYYLWKSASAAWIATLPVLLAAGSLALSPAVYEWPRQIRGGLLVALTMVVGLLPHAYRAEAWSAPALVSVHRRLQTLDVDASGSRIISASTQIAGDPTPAIATAHPAWSTEPMLASRWMNALRGSHPAAQREAEECTTARTWTALSGCLRAWLVTHPADSLLILDTDRSIPDDSVGVDSGRVRVVHVEGEP